MNILFYGTCQLSAVLKTLNLNPMYNIFHIECWREHIDKQYFTDIINKCNIIITQYISDDYRNVDYLSTTYVKQHKNSDCKLILFGYCYFDFYYIDLTYKTFKNSILHQPNDYYYNNMIDCYKNGKSIEYYMENFVNNIDLKTSDELEIIAKNSLDELFCRYEKNKEKYSGDNIYFISTHEYIKQNYKENLLPYSMNHPTKYIIKYVCEEIVKHLQIENTMNYIIDVLDDPKCIIYKCISKNVKFDINNYGASLLNKTNVYDITQIYYNVYNQIGFNE